jgi:hypothetical protein
VLFSLNCPKYVSNRPFGKNSPNLVTLLVTLFPSTKKSGPKVEEILTNFL